MIGGMIEVILLLGLVLVTGIDDEKISQIMLALEA